MIDYEQMCTVTDLYKSLDSCGSMSQRTNALECIETNKATVAIMFATHTLNSSKRSLKRLKRDIRVFKNRFLKLDEEELQYFKTLVAKDMYGKPDLTIILRFANWKIFENPEFNSMLSLSRTF